MGMGIGARLFNGIRSAVNTVAIAEAHMAKAKEVKAPEISGELGVLRFGSRFRGMDSAVNPFHSGVRPATGPTVARPGFEQFKGTGGAFAPEQTMQVSSGMRGMQGPMDQLGSLVHIGSQNPTLQSVSSNIPLTLQSPAQVKAQLDAVGMPMDQQRLVMLQMGLQQLEKTTQLMAQMMKAIHEVAMNAIRNMKG